MNKPSRISPHQVLRSWLINTVYHWKWRIIRGWKGGLNREGRRLINFPPLKKRGGLVEELRYWNIGPVWRKCPVNFSASQKFVRCSVNVAWKWSQWLRISVLSSLVQLCFLRPFFKVVVSPSWRRKRKAPSLLWLWIGWQHFCWTDLLGSSRQAEKRSRRQKQQWTCFVKEKNYPKIAGQLVENGRGDFVLSSQVEIPSPTVSRWCYTRRFPTTIFSESQRHNIVATLFWMLATLF